MPRRFSLKILRNGKRKSKHAAALPPSTTRPNGQRNPANTNEATEAADKKNQVLVRKNNGPGGLEVTTTATSTSWEQDGVSVITPVTGLPPDSPMRNLPSLLPPPPPSRPAENALYAGMHSPTATPLRGDMRIAVPARRTRSNSSDDDVSAMTPSASPQKSYSKRLSRMLTPQRILEDDDDDSRELTVYEDVEGDSIGGGRSPVASKKMKVKFNLEPQKTETASSKKKRRGSMTKRLIKSKRSWFTSTEYFQKAIDSAFDMVDVDKSGDVTPEELHAGLLYIHLKLAVYAGAPACRPASKEYVMEIFRLLDTDDSGTLSKEEFAAVMKILYSQVFTRIVIQWGLTLMIVPVISQYIIRHTASAYWIIHEFLKDIDDQLDPIQRLLWKMWALFVTFTPKWMDAIGELVWTAFCKVPKGVWITMPRTFLTLAQTSIALPYALNHVENFFRRLAHKDVGRHEC